MVDTLKVTNVLSDPTRYNIYQHIIREQKDVSVVEISDLFNIHPNVARLHLSKLEDVNMVTSHYSKSGKGGRPSRLYRLSEQVIEMNFPARDYRTLSSIALEALMDLGEAGERALYSTGKKYGLQIAETYKNSTHSAVTIQQKIEVLEDAGTILGLYAKFSYNEEKQSIRFTVNNCPFKEIAATNHTVVCKMHHLFLKGIFDVLFTESQLILEENMFEGNCKNCKYIANIAIV
nr:helix-turn-helix domain-containing protein [Oceanobacillus saliphilus]